MKKILVLTLITIAILAGHSAQAESLFTLGATQQYQGVPRSLFGGVQARQIGDLISIIMSETVSVNDNLSYSSAKESKTVDTFTNYINKWLSLSLKDSDGFGGTNEVSNSATGSRALAIGDRIAVQVVQ